MSEINPRRSPGLQLADAARVWLDLQTAEPALALTDAIGASDPGPNEALLRLIAQLPPEVQDEFLRQNPDARSFVGQRVQGDEEIQRAAHAGPLGDIHRSAEEAIRRNPALGKLPAQLLLGALLPGPGTIRAGAKGVKGGIELAEGAAKAVGERLLVQAPRSAGGYAAFFEQRGALARLQPKTIEEAQTIANEVYQRSVAQGAKPTPAQMDNLAAEVSAFGSPEEVTIVFHGTSAKPFKTFRLDKIGSGEGNQAYSYGLYLAEREGVSTTYKAPNLNKVGTYKGQRLPVARVLMPQSAYDGVRDLRRRGVQNVTIEDGAREYQKTAAEFNALDNLLSYSSVATARRSMSKDGLAALDRMIANGDLQIPEGTIMQAELRAPKGRFLDWDAPFDEQSEHVQNALRRVRRGTEPHIDNLTTEQLRTRLQKIDHNGNFDFNESTGEPFEYDDLAQIWEEMVSQDPENFADFASTPDFLPDQPGHGIIHQLEAEFGSVEEAASALREAGILGTQYHDAVSRYAIKLRLQRADGTSRVVGMPSEEEARKLGESLVSTPGGSDVSFEVLKDSAPRTRNFVVYDPSIIHTTHINGETVAAYEKRTGEKLLGLGALGATGAQTYPAREIEESSLAPDNSAVAVSSAGSVTISAYKKALSMGRGDLIKSANSVADIRGSLPLATLRSEVLAAVPAVAFIHKDMGFGKLVVTSTKDRSGRPKGSFHHDSLAFDISVQGASTLSNRKKLRDRLRKELGPLGFEVILETNPDHIHIEYDNAQSRGDPSRAARLRRI